MANEPTQEEQKNAQPEQAKKPLPIKKLIMIGIPVFLVQIVVLFFVATKFVGSGQPNQDASASAGQSQKAEEGAEGGEGAGSHMFIVKDLIVNPAGTNGTRFLLISVGFETSTVEGAKEMERKEIQVRDALNSVLTSKTLDDLANVAQREELRSELLSKASELVKSGSVSNVYFSKFIIQ
jgi:flagellar FliL protein